ncbi:hypothetical protein O6H91_05G028100 [Diphasiastrum complanatum]|uniref:Uncharacterized protein n=3 Tax=Diphasiastrum complanatum TaxID=34168 RepID=A0ACC2DLW2_DIPCM|nr:hypothetical protein O6H91_05G028100 [Diphasiastrum complanatum]
MAGALKESLIRTPSAGCEEAAWPRNSHLVVEKGIVPDFHSGHVTPEATGFQSEQEHLKLLHDEENASGKVAAIIVEARKQLWLAFPMISVYLMQYALTIVSISFCGHLGKLELASASIAQSVASVFGYYVLLGMASVLETYCGQAYGAKRYHLLGVYLQRSLIILYISCIPLSLVFLRMEKVLNVLGQAPDIAQKAGEYASWLLPSLYGSALLQPLVKFLQAQSLVFPMAVTSAFALAFHFLLCWLIIYEMHWGFTGAALATSISFWINAGLLLLYVVFSQRCRLTWNGFTKDALRDLKPFIKLSLYSTVMLCLEFWYFEILVMLSGLLPNPELELSALSICLSTVTLNYMIPFGLSAAASTRVSNELGAGNTKSAKLAIYVALSISLVQACAISTSILLVRKVWGYIFSSEQQVVQYVARLLPFLAVSTMMDGMQGILSGVLRGCGRQELGAAINFVVFYGVGVPIGATLAFALKFGGSGIYMGLVSGLSVQTLTMFIVSFTIDWKKEVDDCGQ